MVKKNKLTIWIFEHKQALLDIYLFSSLEIWILYNAYHLYAKGLLNFVEGSFIISNFVLAALFLIRKPYKEFNTNFFDQTISLIAFCSGAALIGTPTTGGVNTVMISNVIIVVANLLGVITLISLGKSFGVFIAFRELKTSGLYGIVRHPMYLTDILLRIGYLISHFKLGIVLIIAASTGCYVYRAILEERFLSRQPEYVEYMKKVKYRFIPYVY